MKQYYIEYKRNDMPPDYTGAALKWANNEKDAVRLMLKKAKEKDGTCVFKRGGSGKILSVTEL